MDIRLKKIADHFGLETQLKKLKEELNELIIEVDKYISKCGEGFNLQQETFDVKCLIEQVEYLTGSTKKTQDNIKEFKINRTLARIKEGYYDDK